MNSIFSAVSENEAICFDVRELESINASADDVILNFRSGRAIVCKQWTWERQGKQVLKLWQEFTNPIGLNTPPRMPQEPPELFE